MFQKVLEAHFLDSTSQAANWLNRPKQMKYFIGQKHRWQSKNLLPNAFCP